MDTQANKYWLIVAFIIAGNIFIFHVLANNFVNYVDGKISMHKESADVELNPTLQKQDRDMKIYEQQRMMLPVAE